MLEKFLELGNFISVDLHGLTKEEARAEIFHRLLMVDNYDSIIFVHGYHGGRVLKELVRKEIEFDRIKKILPLDASRTAYILKKI